MIDDPLAEWNGAAITQILRPADERLAQPVMGCSIRTERWRYIKYANGDEELYDHESDPHEFHNLAEDPEHTAIIGRLAAYLPKKEVPSGPRLPRQRYTQDFDWTKP